MSNKKWEEEIRTKLCLIILKYCEPINADPRNLEDCNDKIIQLLQETEDRVKREVVEEVNKYICNYKEKYRGCGMADSMLALDDLIQSLKGEKTK